MACPICKGKKVVKCPRCRGAGSNYGNKCSHCKGIGQVRCSCA